MQIIFKVILKNLWENTGCLLICLAALCVPYGLWGCGYEPDTSAPERIEITRSADWQGALLYIADAQGPTAGWGSIRIYDNVSGVVEVTLEQTMAAVPSDLFVSPDGGKMFVASAANGLIDSFNWNGNSWQPSGTHIETPGSCLAALKAGPDSRLYAADCSEGNVNGRIFVTNTSSNIISSETITLSELQAVTGFSWSVGADRVYLVGIEKESGKPVLEVAQWPSLQKISVIELQVAMVHQIEVTPDGRYLYIMGQGEVQKLDATTTKVVGSLKPDTSIDADYVDAAFSTDSRYLFITGGPIDNKSNIYVIDLGTGATVHQMNRVAVEAGGIQKVE